MDHPTRGLTRRSARLAILASLALLAVSAGIAPTGAANAPRITSVSPAEAPSGATVVVTGHGLGGNVATVSVAGIQAPVTSAVGNRLTFAVPVAARFGPTTIVVTSPSRMTARAPFTVVYDGLASPVVDASASVRTTVGREGGTVESQGVRLAIPEGALSEDVVVSLTPLRDLSGTPLDGTVFGGAHLEPSGLEFLRPATLTFPLPAATSAHEVIGFSTFGDADLHLVPHQVHGGSVSIAVQHFSSVGGSTGSLNGYLPDSAEAQAMSAMASAQQACAVERAAGIYDGPACAQQDDALATALRTWYLTAVRPRLEASAGASYFVVEPAFNEWLRWAAQVAEWTGDALLPESQIAEDLAREALEGVARTRLGNCTGSDLVSQLRDAMRVSDLATAGAFAVLAPDLPSPLNGEIIDACAHVRVAGITLPAVLASGSDRNTLTGSVVIDVWTGPDLPDGGAEVEVRGDGLSLVGSVAIDAAGAFEARLRGDEDVLGATLHVTATSVRPVFVNLGLNVYTESRPVSVRPRIAIEATPTDIAPGATSNLLVRVAGDDPGGGTVTFSVAGNGAVSPTTRVTDAGGAAGATYTAASVGGDATVTASLEDDPGVTRSASIAITVSGGIDVSVTPAAAIIAPGAQATFVASVTGTTDTAVTWSASCGSITATGLYTAPASPSQCVVTATSHADPAESATADVSVVATGPASLTVSPGVAYTAPAGQVSFTANLTNHPGTVSWSASCGAIDSAGRYTAPATLGGTSNGRCTVTARSSDESLSASATVEIGVMTLTTATGYVFARAQDFTADPIDVEQSFDGTIAATASAIQPYNRFTAELGLSAAVTTNVLTIGGTASHDGSGSSPGVAGSASGVATATFYFVVTGGRVPWSLVVDGTANASTDAFGSASTSVNYRLGPVHLDPTASVTSSTRGRLPGIAVTGGRDVTGGVVGYEKVLTGVADAGWLTPGRYGLEIYLSGLVAPNYYGPGSASANGSLTSTFSAGAHP